MSKFIFVIDGKGIQSWMPMDLELGDHFYGGIYYGSEFYKKRARLNWDRGSYYMEMDISGSQQDVLVDLLSRKKDWIGGKNYIEEISNRCFETETGFENPFDPDWSFSFDQEWEQNRRKWLERAGFKDFDPWAFVLVSTDKILRKQLNTKAEDIFIDGCERTLALCSAMPVLPYGLMISKISIIKSNFSDFCSREN